MHTGLHVYFTLSGLFVSLPAGPNRPLSLFLDSLRVAVLR